MDSFVRNLKLVRKKITGKYCHKRVSYNFVNQIKSYRNTRCNKPKKKCTREYINTDLLAVASMKGIRNNAICRSCVYPL